MKTLLKIVGVLLLLVVLVGAGVYAWASSVTSRKLAQKYAIHSVDFPIPFPLSADEIKKLKLKPEAADSLARVRALERGKHLLDSRYACKACHGANFGGGVMVDAAPIGRLLGPNLTTGKGSRTLNYHAADWDHIVRHGIHPDSTPAVMPSVDFRGVTDQELSDIVMYIRSQPAVDNTVPRVSIGPVLKVMVATGKARVSADVIDHQEPHAVLPPDISNQMEFGRHLAMICTGCHREDLSGGPIAGGDPAWPPAQNITPAGLTDWEFQHFAKLMREGKRPDGSSVRAPMSDVPGLARNMSEPELEALWTYLKSVKPVPTKS